MTRARRSSETESQALQVGALCYRIADGKTRILLITSRRTRRWVIPKGWPIPRLDSADSASTEAWEEAGVRGKASKTSIGSYEYLKIAEKAGDIDQPCLVSVYPLKVRALEKVYPEHKDRERRWFTRREASKAVEEPELQKILAGFSAARL